MTVADERTRIDEAAHSAWAARAEFDLARFTNSFQTQLFRKLKVGRADYEFDPDMFPDEFNPMLRLGAEVDGLIICLNKHQALSVVAWRCAQKGCESLMRTPVDDLVSLGRALAHGESISDRQPKCRAHE